jgi:hypothetical protein
MWIVYYEVKYWGDYGKLESDVKDVVMAYFKLLPEHSARMTDQTHKKLRTLM